MTPTCTSKIVAAVFVTELLTARFPFLGELERFIAFEICRLVTAFNGTVIMANSTTFVGIVDILYIIAHFFLKFDETFAVGALVYLSKVIFCSCKRKINVNSASVIV